jgi:glycerol-3-phosphate acyltransferase PlsX
VINIALDAMGGDNAPDVNVGAYRAAKELDVSITLVGQESRLTPLVNAYSDWPHDKITIQNASEVVAMSESPSQSFRKKKDSSIRVGLELVKTSHCHGFVSAGNTGAIMASAIFVLGRITHVDRPSLATIFPSNHKKIVILDVGASVDCKATHLAQFAIMGTIFAEHILNIPSPKVGLLNIGEEKDKGNTLTQETNSLLNELNLNYIGYVEGKEITKGHADVVVCDGFTGNNILKFGEGLVSLFKSFFKAESKSSLLSAMGLLLLKPAFSRFKHSFDYEEYGGAHLLGVNGVTIVSHGSSSPTAIKNAIRIAKSAYEHQLVDKIETHLEKRKSLTITH